MNLQTDKLAGAEGTFLTGSHPFNLILSLSYSALLDVHKKVVEQRDQYAIECEQMRRSATPRYVHSFGQYTSPPSQNTYWE